MTTERLDLRLAPAALGAWGAAALSLGWPPARALVGGLLLLGVAAGLGWRGRRRTQGSSRGLRRHAPALAAATVVTAASFGVAGLRTSAVEAGPIDELARDGAFVSVAAVVTSDPVARQGTFSAYTLVRLRIEQVDRPGTGHGRSLAGAGHRRSVLARAEAR